MTNLAAISQTSDRGHVPVDVVDSVSSFQPADIRRAIAHWVGQDRMDMADALVAAGLAMHPDSEDMLVIAALVAEMNQDWAQAQDCLEHLLQIKGESASSEIDYHLVRVLRCRASYHLAIGAARRGLARHPDHAGLLQEFAELSAMLESVPVTVNAVPQT